MRLKHYTVFKKKIKVLNWESLRNDENEKPYYLPYTKNDYLLKVDTEYPSCLTKTILHEIEKMKIKKIFSIGSGIASQEYQLKKFSNNEVVVTDYTKSVLRLKQFNIFDDAFILDVFNDKLPVDESWVVLFPRIDTEFDDEQLSELFKKCYELGVKQICFIPAELLSLRIVLAEIKILLISIFKRKPRVFCGYARSMNSFKKLWNPYYEISKQYKEQKQILFLHFKEKKYD